MTRSVSGVTPLETSDSFQSELATDRPGDEADDTDEFAEKQELTREDKRELVTFELHEQRFGVDIQDVNEVKNIPGYTEVFHTPEFLVGVVNLRGDIIALLDIGLFFQMPRTTVEGQKMIILEHDNQEAGIVADSMHDVHLIPEDELQPPPPTISGISSKWIEGVINVNDEPWIILDIPAIFQSDRLQNL
jgi:purine-binding chemotaxis protein CheW